MSSPSKLFSCVDANSILRSPINNSTAKNHWSFSKSKRFKTTMLYCDKMYNIPQTQSKRRTSFGYGKKTDLDIGKNRHNVVPPPDTYNLNSFVEINKMHQKGFTPRQGREEVAPVSYIPSQPKKVPGPANYSPIKKKNTPLWSMRPKTSTDLFTKTTQKIVPGPGRYESTEGLNNVGKYYTSKHRCSKSKVWNPKRSSRFAKSTTQVPPPGTYYPINDMSASGDYVLSQNISAGKRKVLLSDRHSFVDEDHKRIDTPGPGTYRFPSDFGQYDEIGIRYSIHKGSTAKSRFQK